MTPLTEDEIEDFLYFARLNELEDLKVQVLQSSRQHNCSDADILKAAADEESGNTALHYSSANGHLEMVKYLLEAFNIKEGDLNEESKAIINARNKSGNTPLHWAALNGHVEVLVLLLQYGADPSILNAAGHDALFEAELNEKTKAAEALLAEGKELESGLDVNGADAEHEEEDVDMGDTSVGENTAGGHV